MSAQNSTLNDHWGRRFAAAFLEDVRLIVNVRLVGNGPLEEQGYS